MSDRGMIDGAMSALPAADVERERIIATQETWSRVLGRPVSVEEARQIRSTWRQLFAALEERGAT